MEAAICCNFRCSGAPARPAAGTLAADGRGALSPPAAGALVDECDPQGVVFYANYLVYFDVAMTELWREAVGPYAQMIETGADMVVAEATVRYRGSARFDDEIDLVARSCAHRRPRR